MTLEGRRDKELAKQDIKFNPIENGERFELAAWWTNKNHEISKVHPSLTVLG